jgi:hypothetical protein
MRPRLAEPSPGKAHGKIARLHGKLTVRGEDFKLTGWKRIGEKDGKPWLSLSVEPAGEANTKSASASADPSDVPF